MKKVYRVYEHICEDSYSPSEEHTIGIFTDAEAAENVMDKLIVDKKSRLTECDIEYKKFDEVLSKLSYEERFHYNHSEEYIELCHEARQLEYTHYNIEELIINQLYREL